jgi:16S rRNA (cytosine1402-N4)-methyltransferase
MNVSKTSLEISHFPVLLSEVIKICSPIAGKNFLDCTFGGGSYSKTLLSYKNTKVTALDRDKYILKFANKLNQNYKNRFNFHHEKFSNLDKIIKKELFDVVIFDLGLSSFQLKDLSRGFSFNSKDKLDMTMGLSSVSAEDVVNNCEENVLKLIIKIFGDEKEASKIAKNIVLKRNNKKITTAKELVEIIEMSKKRDRSKKINISTKTFQALRIFVNKETTELIEGIIKATKVLKPGGKLITISFHSIEDKIIKFYFSNYSSNKSKPSRYMPEKINNEINLFNDYRNKIVKASNLELKKNPPSRSAKLRFATRSKNIFKFPDELKIKFNKYLELESLYEKN